MLRMMISGAVLAFAVPAMAQQMPAADPAANAATRAAQPAQSTPSAPANQASQVATIVESEYPVYDTDKSGELDRAEFSKWLLALKQQEMQASKALKQQVADLQFQLNQARNEIRALQPPANH